MANWKATLDDGRVITLEADTQPSEQEILGALDAFESTYEGQLANYGITAQEADKIQKQTDLLHEQQRLRGGAIDKTEPGNWLTQLALSQMQGIPAMSEQFNAAGAASLEPTTALPSMTDKPVSLLTSLAGPYGAMLEQSPGFQRARKAVQAQLQGAADIARTAKESVQRVGQATQGPDVVRELGAAATSLGPTIAAAPGGLPAMLVAAGLQSYGSTYADAQRNWQAQGKPEAEAKTLAAQDALVSGVTTALVTAGFGRTGVEAFGTEPIRKGLKAAIAKLLQEAGMEGYEEASDQVLQDLYAKMRSQPNLTARDVARDVLFAGGAGAIIGGLANVPGALGSISKKGEDNAPPTRTEAPPVGQPPGPPPPVTPPRTDAGTGEERVRLRDDEAPRVETPPGAPDVISPPTGAITPAPTIPSPAAVSSAPPAAGVSALPDLPTWRGLSHTVTRSGKDSYYVPAKGDRMLWAGVTSKRRVVDMQWYVEKLKRGEISPEEYDRILQSIRDNPMYGRSEGKAGETDAEKVQGQETVVTSPESPRPGTPPAAIGSTGETLPVAPVDSKYGVPAAQWDEMANYNDADQMAKWGTTRSKLMEAEIMAKYGTPPPAPKRPSRKTSRVEQAKQRAEETNTLTPMMAQYKRIKEQLVKEGHDALVAFRLGDFYEFFFEDAGQAASILNVALTKRNNVPMAGIPAHASRDYFGKLVSAGKKVAVVDQTGDVVSGKPAERKVTEILNPESKPAPPPVTPPTPTTPQLSGKWTPADVEFFLKKLESGEMIFWGGNDLGLPAFQEIPNLEHKGYGLFTSKTPQYEISVDGGGSMDRTDSGVSYTRASVSKGTFPYDFEAVKAKLRSYLTPQAATGVASESPKLTVPAPVQPAVVTTPPTSGPVNPKLDAIRAKREEIKARLRQKLGQTNVGVDPEVAVIAAELAVNYVEEGVVQFADFAKRVKAELPDIWQAIKQYLHGAWTTAANTNPNIDEPSRAAVARELTQLDYEPTEEQGKSPSNEPESDIRPGDQSGKPKAGGGGIAPGPTAGEGDRPDVGGSLPETDTGAATGGDVTSGGQRPERPGAQPGAIDAGGILGGAPTGGAGTDTTRPGDRAGVSDPAHNNVGRQNYFLSNPEAIVGGGPKARFAKNQEAIDTYHTLIAAKRDPTSEELDKLAAYTGWGSFGQELFNGTWDRPAPKEGWETEDAWLRDQLGEAGWKSAQQSIINAHYTDPVTVTSMWGMIRKMGFTGGRVLEPSVGIGNFFSLMPRDLMANSSLTGIELDTMTGRIAQMLHPQANIQIKGYQDSKTADNFYDLILGNWPFADIKPADRRYNHLNANLHDYFFIKALDQVRPGGLIVGITSAGTMDKKSPTIRRYMAARAELVASFRLPAGTFGKYAGTKVTTDIIILRKRPTPLSDPKDDWIDSRESETPAGTFSYNAYYWNKPKNIIGTIGFGRGTTSGRPGMIVTPPPNHEQAIKNLPNLVPANVFQPWEAQKQTKTTIANTDSGARQLSIVERNGELYQVQGEQLVLADELKSWKKKSAKETKARLEEAKAAISIRTALDGLMDAYRKNTDTEAPRKRLKQAYTDFVAQYGKLRHSFMLRYMENLQDSSAISVMNLEDSNGRQREVLERDVMRKRPVMASGSIDDAFAMQRNNSLHFSLQEVANLAKTTVEAARARLIELGQIFQTPTGEWQARDEYLQGNVRRKMREAVEAKELGMDMTRNIEALQSVMPKDTPHFNIEVRMGANWVSIPDYVTFIQSLIPVEAKDVHVERMASGWRVKIDDDTAKRSNEATVVWGHMRPDAPIDNIIQAAMNGVNLRMYDPSDDGPIFNQTATEEVNGKIEGIREQFQKWIWLDGDRTARLSEEYNEVANALVTPQRDGSYLRLEGLALRLGDSEFDFRKHQQDAVARFTQDGKGMAAHEVGTGKTFTMAGLIMEGRRLGVFRKPIVFAHNANSASVRSDFQAAYPSGKFLYLDSLNPKERQARLRQIALDDWDAVIVPHSLISRFTLSQETMMELAHDEIQALEDEIASVMADIGASYVPSDLNDPKAFNRAVAFVPGAHTAKKLVKQRLRILERIQKKAQDASKEDAVLFEELGVDAILVDEAHIFKKISLATRKQIKGLSKDESGAGFALSLLSDYVKRQNNGKGIFLFTGTPVTNTLNEVYNMMRYVMSSDMTEAGIQRFDDWFNMFADSESEVEMTDAGTYEAVDRLRAFINVSELARMAGRYFDVVFAKTMPEFKDRTSPDGMTEDPIGRPFKKVVPVTTDMSPEQMEHMADIRRRFSIWKNANGRQRRAMMMLGQNTPLQLGTESSLAALDYRLIDETAPDYKGSKVNAAVVKLLDIYRENPDTTQMVFMEQGYNDYVDRKKAVRDADGNVQLDANGEKVMTTERVAKFNIARDIVQKLMDGGVKPEQIAIFANMKLNPAKDMPNDPLRRVKRLTTAVTKEDLARLMREGEIKIAFGQTTTMGTGVNAQTFLRAIHHLDAPWQPGEFEQRNGRGWRQGNKWNTLFEHRYFAEGSGDGKRWQFLLNKVRFINRFMEALKTTGKTDLRTLEGEGADASEEGDVVADYEQSFGAAAGDPRQMLKAQLSKRIRKLEIKSDNHSTGVYRAKQTIKEILRDKPQVEDTIAKRERDSESFHQFSTGQFAVTIEGKTYTDRKEADKALAKVPVYTTQTEIGQMGEFKLTALRDSLYVIGPSGREYSASPSIASISGNLRQIQHHTDEIRASLKRELDSIPKLQEMAASQFTDQEKLDNARLALEHIEAEIELSPFPAPSWLRNTVPMGSDIHIRKDDGTLQSVDVAAHRWDNNNWWVLYEEGGGRLRPVPYTEVLDETGNPMFEERKFEKPPSLDTKTPTNAPTPAPEPKKTPNNSFLLNVPKQAKPLEAQRKQIQRILDKMERLELESEEWSAETIHYSREIHDSLTSRLGEIEASLLETTKKSDRFESALNKAIEKTRPGGELMEGVTGAPVWMTKAIVNAMLRAIRAAYLGSKNLGKAFAAGIDYLRSQNIEGYDESEAEEWLRPNIRAFAEANPTGMSAEELEMAAEGATVEDIRDAASPSLGDPDLQDEIEQAVREAEKEGITTKVFNAWDRVLNRARLTPEVIQNGIVYAKNFFNRFDLEVEQDDSGRWKLKDESKSQEDAGRRMVDALTEELRNQEQDAESKGYLGNLVDSIVVNMSPDRVTAFSQSVKDELYALAQGERSHRGLMLGMLSRGAKTVHYVARNIRQVLHREYANRFGGDRVREILRIGRGEFQALLEGLSESDLEALLDNAPKLKAFIARLKVKPGVKPPNLTDLIKLIFRTPFYRQSELGIRFAEALADKYELSGAERAEAVQKFNDAFEAKFAEARVKAQKKAVAQLTPQERIAWNKRRPMWLKLQDAMNSEGEFDPGIVLSRIAVANKMRALTDADVERFRSLSERMQRKKDLELGHPERENLTLHEQQALRKEIETLWSKHAYPLNFIHNAENVVNAAYEWASATLLLKLGFFSRQIIDVVTQGALHNPTRAAVAALERAQINRDQGKPGETWKELTSALGQSYRIRAQALRQTLSSVRHRLRTGIQTRNVEQLIGKIGLFERMLQDADTYAAKGDHVRAGILRIFAAVRWGRQFAGAMDDLQGVPAQYQEMRQDVVTTLRRRGKSRAEAEIAADEIMRNPGVEWRLAIEQAKQFSDMFDLGYDRTQLRLSALDMVMARAYQRMRAADMPADDFREQHMILRETQGWNVREEGGLGTVVAAPFRALSKLGEKAPPLAIFSTGFGRFGNAIAIGAVRAASWTPLGYFSGVFGVSPSDINPQTGIANQGSPWYRTEADRQQRKIEATIGTTLAPIVIVMVASGLAKVQWKPPEDKEERDLWTKAGHRPGTVEINLPDGSYIPLSLTVGPLRSLAPYFVATGAVLDRMEQAQKRQDRLNAQAEKQGLPPGKAPSLNLYDYAYIAGQTAYSTLLGGRTAQGLIGAVTEYGIPNARKTAAAAVSPLLPPLPAIQEAARMAGVYLDPKQATFFDFLTGLPLSGASRVNLLGDKVGTENDIQRVIQIATGGTFPFPVSNDELKAQTAYGNLFATEYRPSSIDPSKGYSINGEFRPLTPTELQRYTIERGQNFKSELEALGDLSGTPPAEVRKLVQGAFQKANRTALSALGVEVAQPRVPQARSTSTRKRTRPDYLERQIATVTRRALPSPRLPTIGARQISIPSIKRPRRPGRLGRGLNARRRGARIRKRRTRLRL